MYFSLYRLSSLHTTVLVTTDKTMKRLVVIIHVLLAASSSGLMYKDLIDLEELTDIFGLSNCVEGKFFYDHAWFFCMCLLS